MLKRIATLIGSGVQFIALLTLNDDGDPVYDHQIAEALASFGISAFACTPNQFLDLMAAAIAGQDISQWQQNNDIVTTCKLR